jgi:hypothetical protein
MSLGQLHESGGASSALNLTAPAVIKPTPGRLMRVTVLAANASAAVTLNDCTTVAATAAANQFFVIPANTPAGTVYFLEWPCSAGIVIAGAALGGGMFAVSYF